jgi:hypothetical protein
MTGYLKLQDDENNKSYEFNCPKSTPSASRRKSDGLATRKAFLLYSPIPSNHYRRE